MEPEEFLEARPDAGTPFIPPRHPFDVMSPADLIEYYANFDENSSVNTEEK